MKGLRSASRVLVAQILWQTHSRLWHAPAKRTRDLLQAAGAPERVLAEVQNVVDACSSCREWQRRSNRPVVSLTITSQFNEGVQFDLLFLEDNLIVAHVICMCIRWAQGQMVKSREPKEVLAAIDHFWIRQYGPPKTITSDQEGALFSDEGISGLPGGVLNLRASLRELMRISLNDATTFFGINITRYVPQRGRMDY